MNERMMIESDSLFHQIKCVLDEARNLISKTVNTAMVHAFWQVGKYIVEYEQQGSQRAEYGKKHYSELVKTLDG